jgi:NAD(P)-dependent dehydrogenase (short-subunit alcohol dehydrogenase family)
MTKDNARMLVLGGHGVLGTMIAEAAQAAGWTAIRTSRRPAAGFRHVDLAEPQTLERVLGEADVIVSTVPDEQLVAEHMVLGRGGLLINVAAIAASCAERLRSEPGTPRGTVVMNAGIAPGLTNLLAADLLARHPEADEVEMVFTISVKGSTGPSGAHPDWLTAARRHRTTVVRLPEPFGRRRCLGIAEQNNGWLGAVAAGKTVSTYLCVAERGMFGALLAMNAAGLIGRLPRSALTAKPVPETTAEPVRHWVAVRRRGTLLAASSLRCRGDYRSAAAATVLTAGQLTGHGSPLPAGVLLPEDVLTIGELEPGLARAGITVVGEPATAGSVPAPGGRELTRG